MAYPALCSGLVSGPANTLSPVRREVTTGAPVPGRSTRRRSAWSVALGVAVLGALSCVTAASVGAAGRRAPGELLRIPIARYDGTLTPTTFELGYPLMTLVYDTLLWRDANGVPRPWLARSVKRSRQGMRLTIRLRKGVHWHDGRPLSARDVAFTFGFFSQRFHPRFTPELASVRDVRAIGGRTVRVDLSRPSLGFDDQPLADMPIIPRHLWRGLSPARLSPPGLPVGSGPYRLTAAGRTRGYTFRANRRYFLGRPRVSRIRVPIEARQPLTLRGLERREVDMLPTSLPESAAEQVRGAVGVAVRRGPAYAGTALLLNVRRSPFKRRSARRAVMAAIDLRRLVRNVGPGAAADRGYLHPESPWASRTVLQPRPRATDRRVLSKLPRIRVLAADNDSARLESGRQVVLALRRAGARAKLVRVTRDRLGRAIGEDGSRPRFRAAITSIPALASHDPDFLGRLFGAGSGLGQLNYTGYRSAKFDALARRVARARTSRARRAAVAAELRLLARDAPAVPLLFPQGAFAYRPAAYAGWIFVKGTGILDKRSFLPGTSSTRPSAAGALDADADADNTNALDVLKWGSLGLLVLVLGLGAVALARRRKVER